MKKTFRVLAALILVASATLLGGCSGSGGSSGDVPLISDGISVARVSINDQPTSSAHIIVPFGKEVPGLNFINIVIDLNNDGKWGDYSLGGGSIQSEWGVRNMPAVIIPSEPNGFHFSLKDFNADKLTNLKLRAVITSTPISTANFPQGWDGTIPSPAVTSKELQVTNITVENISFAIPPDGSIGVNNGPGLPGNRQKLPSAWISAADQVAANTKSVLHKEDSNAPQAKSVLHKGVPNLKQPAGAKNECVPTATANSLLWLAAQNPVGFKGMDSAKLINDLKTTLQWNGDTGGVKPANITAGKQAYIDKNKLPVEAHNVGSQVGAAKDPEIFNKIYAELEKGQDVEIGIVFLTGANGEIKTRHMVTVVGATDASAVDGGGLSLQIHDSNTDNPGVESYNVETNLDGQVYLPDWEWTKGLAGGIIEYVYADSPVTQTPATPAKLNVIGETSFNVTHTKGVTACPTPIGTFSVQNIGGGPMSFAISGIPGWLNVNPSNGTTDAGSVTPVSLEFNCTNYSDGEQTTNLSIKGTDTSSGTSAGEQNVTVVLTVQ